MYVNFMINILNYNVINIILLRKRIHFYYFTNFRCIDYIIFICTHLKKKLIQFFYYCINIYTFMFNNL